jgi:hypothetical protein
MTQEERIEYNSRFEDIWTEFTTKYPPYKDFPIKDIARHFFEMGRADIMDRVWKELMK